MFDKLKPKQLRSATLDIRHTLPRDISVLNLPASTSSGVPNLDG